MDDTAAVSRGGAAALLASLKSLQQTRRGWSGEKRRPICGERRSLPLSPLRHPCYPINPRHPYGPRARGGRERRLNQCVGHPACIVGSKAAELMHFAPCAMLGESSAHADRIMQNAPRRNVPSGGVVSTGTMVCLGLSSSK